MSNQAAKVINQPADYYPYFRVIIGKTTRETTEWKKMDKWLLRALQLMKPEYEVKSRRKVSAEVCLK